MKTAEEWREEAREHERMAEWYKQNNAPDSYRQRRDMAQMCWERAEETRMRQ